MNVFEFRQWVEQAIPIWVLAVGFGIFLLAISMYKMLGRR